MVHSIIRLASLILLLLSSSCTNTEEYYDANFSDQFLSIDVSLPEYYNGKSSWSDDDRVVFLVHNRVESIKDIFAPQSIDGATAKFELQSLSSINAEACYGYIVSDGVSDFMDGGSIRVGAISHIVAGSFFPVSAGKANLSTKRMEIKALYGQICFSVEHNGISYVVFEGNGHEKVAKDIIINLDDSSVTSGTDEECPSSYRIKIDVAKPGTYYLPLFPGLCLPSGYQLTAYDEYGKEVMSVKSDEAIIVEQGVVYHAPLFEEGRVSDVFDTTKVLYSFGILSDTHINDCNDRNCKGKLKCAFEQLKALALKTDSDGIDGVMIAGDLIDRGEYIDNQLPIFKSLYEDEFNPEETPLVYALGNHDPDAGTCWTPSVYSFAKIIKSKFGDKYEVADIETTMRDKYECRHCLIGDYHILSVTPNGMIPVSYPNEVVGWLDKTLMKITQDNPKRYVIFITHPMIYDTVYGSLLGPTWLYGYMSDCWSTSVLTPTLIKYPQVIAFGGHLHFPINDPRSIWQGDFTAVGCGSTCYMAIEDGQYENMSSTTVMNDASDISSGLLLQFDVNGNARITKMFFSQETTFGYPWEISHPTHEKTHLRKYNHVILENNNSAPVLGSMQFEQDGACCKVVFDAAIDDEFAHHYVLSLKKDGTTISTYRILSDFYRNQCPGQMKSQLEQTFGPLASGDYEVILVAEDSWGAQSVPLIKTMHVNAH